MSPQHSATQSRASSVVGRRFRFQLRPIFAAFRQEDDYAIATSCWLSPVLLTLVAGISATAFAISHRTVVGVQPDGRILVPNGQMLTPAGTHIEVNDRPLGMVLEPGRQPLAVVTGSNFNPRALHLIDIDTRTLKQTMSIANSFVGVAFSPAGDTIYVGGGASNDVKIFTAAADGRSPRPARFRFPAGGAERAVAEPDGSRLYVALNMTNEVAVIDTATRTILTAMPVGIYPYTTVVSADGSKVYVSNWGGRCPARVTSPTGCSRSSSIGGPASRHRDGLGDRHREQHRVKTIKWAPSDGHGAEPGGDRLYVTNANSDTVSVINTD